MTTSARTDAPADLFAPITIGDFTLANRITMAPLTRTRADERGVHGELAVEYYRQRASVGLIVSEGTYPLQESKAFPGQPGIETDEQVAAWRKVTDAVHAEGGLIFMQLMHSGRVSHTEINGTSRVVGPSAVAIDGEARTPKGKQPFPVPHALTLEEIETTKAAMVAGARNAIRAGFDGVEIHSANGYLLHEFLSPASNVRDDQYGGSPENRARFVVEVTQAVAEAIGAGRTGIRISPEHNIQGALETDADDVRATYGALLDGIGGLGLAYLSVLHHDVGGELVQGLRSRFDGVLIGNTGFAVPTTREDAVAALAYADAVAVGRPLIANPDLVARWSTGAPENTPDPATFYGATAEGYTDYPTLVGASA